jgi:hypothetical protein
MQTFTAKQLTTILSALDGKTANPNSKATALKRIEAHAADLGLPAADLLDSSARLLDGRMAGHEWAAAMERIARERAEMAKKDKKQAAAKTAEVKAAAKPKKAKKQAVIDGDDAQEPKADRKERIARAKAASKQRLAAMPKKATKVTAIDRLEAILRRPGGASMGTIAQEMEWLPKTARAAIAVKIRRERGHLVETERKPGEGQLATVYRIVG